MAAFDPNQNTVSDMCLDDTSFKKISSLIERRAGIILRENKRGLIVSRLSKRLRELGVSQFSDYCSLLQSDLSGSEFSTLLSLITTNVTKFFREPHHFDFFGEKIMPNLTVKSRQGGCVRIWSAGCSSGQEPYSAAIVAQDTFSDALAFDFRILATDIDPIMIEDAKKSKYSQSEIDDLPQGLRKKYFLSSGASDDNVSVIDSVRGLVTFNQLNLLENWPMKRKFDVIFCRNVAIYFSHSSQVDLWRRFSEVLEVGGFLFIGHSERISQPESLGLKAVGITTYQKT